MILSQSPISGQSVSELFAIEMLCRQVTWSQSPISGQSVSEIQQLFQQRRIAPGHKALLAGRVFLRPQLRWRRVLTLAVTKPY